MLRVYDREKRSSRGITLLDACPKCGCKDVVELALTYEHAKFDRTTGERGLPTRDGLIAVVDYECEQCAESVVAP